MHIYVDADACPRVIREILFRAAQRTGVPLTLVANQPVPVPKAAHIRAVQVPAGFDVADNHIVQQVTPADMVVTQDIPLAAEVVAKGALAINPRGEEYTPDNVRQRLAMRNLMESLRSTGEVSGGPAVFGTRDQQRFANALDRWLAKHRAG